MATKSKRLPNPCRLKGRYLGGISTGRVYSTGTAPKGCECMYAGSCGTTGSSLSAEKIFQAITHSGRGKGSIDRLKTKRLPKPKRQVFILPCQEAFRSRDSLGSKAYRQTHKTKFFACDEVEGYLVDNQLVLHAPREVLGLSFLFEEDTVDGEAYGDDYFTTSFDLAGEFIVRAPTPAEIEAFNTRKESVGSSSRPWTFTFSELTGRPARNFRMAILREMMDKKYFEKTFPNDHQKYGAAAYLMDKFIAYGVIKNELDRIFSSEDECTLYERKVNRAISSYIAKEHPKKLKALQVYENKLTKKQRKILDKWRLCNAGRVTKASLAREFKITVSAIEKHMDAITKKFKKYFPKEPVNFTIRQKPARHKEEDLLYDGLYRVSSSEKVHPLYRVDLITGQKMKIDLPSKRLKFLGAAQRQRIKAVIRGREFAGEAQKTPMIGLSTKESLGYAGGNTDDLYLPRGQDENLHLITDS